MLKKCAPSVLFAVLAFTPACVTVEEAPLPKTVLIAPGQKTLIVIYTAPGPWVTAGPDTNMESAAKYLPGLGIVVEGAQDDRNLKLSAPVGEYLAAWKPEMVWTPVLVDALRTREFPGTWIPPALAAAELDAETQRKFNQAKDVLEWRRRYFLSEPSELRQHRNYSTFLSLADAFVLEVNLQHGLTGTTEGNFNPALAAKARLYRAGTMRLLWVGEADAERPAPAGKEKSLWDYMNAPKELTRTYESLMPELAEKISTSFHAAMSASRNLTSPSPPPPQPPPVPSQ